MAEAADDSTPPPPAPKSGGFMGTLVNGIGIFVLTLGAVVAGGSINAKLHPLPDLQLDKDGKIKAIVPVVVRRPRRGRRSRQGGGVLRHRPAVGGQFRRRLRGAFPANYHGDHGPRSKGHRQRAEEHSLDPQQPAAAHEQPQLSVDDVARRQGKAAAGGAHRGTRGAEERRRVPTWTTCCSPPSWCSNGRRRATRHHLGRRGVGVAREKCRRWAAAL